MKGRDLPDLLTRLQHALNVAHDNVRAGQPKKKRLRMMQNPRRGPKLRRGVLGGGSSTAGICELIIFPEFTRSMIRS